MQVKFPCSLTQTWSDGHLFENSEHSSTSMKMEARQAFNIQEHRRCLETTMHFKHD